MPEEEDITSTLETKPLHMQTHISSLVQLKQIGDFHHLSLQS